MKVAFRVDAGVAIGGGHLSRCLTLAESLMLKGVSQCYFILKSHKGNSSVQVKNKGFNLKLLPLEYEPNYSNDYAQWVGGDISSDAELSLAYLKKNGFEEGDWLIVDHYGLDVRFETVISATGIKVGVIDDLVNRYHNCKFLVDQTCGREAKEYTGLVNQDSKVLAGSSFCMLRPEFRNHKAKAFLKRLACAEYKNIFINFGSTDPTNVTTRIIKTIEDLHCLDTVKVVIAIGSNTPYLKEIQKGILESRHDIELQIDANNMSELMLSADIAIGAAGATTWERCALGLPSILIKTAENQTTVIERVIKYGVGILYSVDSGNPSQELQNCLDYILENYRSISEKCFELVDGQGVDKIVDQIIGNN